MRANRWWLGVACTFYLATASAPATAAGTASARAQDKITPEARAYFKNGVELIQANPPNYQDGYYQFKLAYDKSSSWKVLGNLGLCAVKLERDGEAIVFYDDYLRRGGKQIDKDEREDIERDLLLIKGNGATLTLTSKEPELTITDVRSGSAVPEQSYPLTNGKAELFLRAGSHRITARAADGRSLSWEVTLEPGSKAAHDFDYDVPVAAPVVAPSPEPAPVLAPPAPAAPEAGVGGVRIAGFVTTGVGVLALGGGVVAGLMFNHSKSEAEAQCDSAMVCHGDAKADFDDANSKGKLATILYIGGGAVTAVGLAMIIFGQPSKPSEEAAKIRLTPFVSPELGGVIATGTF